MFKTLLLIENWVVIFSYGTHIFYFQLEEYFFYILNPLQHFIHFFFLLIFHHCFLNIVSAMKVRHTSWLNLCIFSWRIQICNKIGFPTEDVKMSKSNITLHKCPTSSGDKAKCLPCRSEGMCPPKHWNMSLFQFSQHRNIKEDLFLSGVPSYTAFFYLQLS